MNEREQEFLRRLRAAFKVESEEHVQAMSSGLVALEKQAAGGLEPARVETIFRHAHSLKGAARAVNYAEVESLCQALEEVFVAAKNRKLALVPQHFDTLHRGVDLIGRLASSPEGKGTAEDRGQITPARQAMLELVAVGTGSRPAFPVKSAPPMPVSAPTPAARPPPAPPVAPKSVPPAPPPVSVAPPRPVRPASASPLPPEVAVPAPVARPALAETIRVSTAKLDRLLLQAEAMLTVRQGAVQRAGQLRDFEALFNQFAQRWTARDGGRRETREAGATVSDAERDVGELKLLEEKLRALRKAAADDEHQVRKQVNDLMADSKSLVMLPFSTLSDLFPKLVRDLSRDQGKEAELVIHGTDLEVDKRVLEQMKDPLIHLLRNCLAHGIEEPAVRAAQGKPAKASLVVTAEPADGNRVEIRVADDGAGIDTARVKDAAVRHGVITPDRAAQLGDAEARELIFLSEVSTSPIITEISGRGLGMAIVREKTAALGGQVLVESRVGAGTTFRLLLPVALSTFHGILVRLGDQTLVIPTSSVERVARIKVTEIATVENRETVRLDGRVLSLARLEDVLEIPLALRKPVAREFTPVVVLGLGDERIAFAVDEVLHDEEVLVKTLVRPLSRVRNIASATVLASGRVAPILHPGDLIKSARKLGAPAMLAPRSPAPAGAAPKAKSILLVEDSITSRMLLKGILELAGYRVRTAADGVEALTTLRTGDFDLVVSDVEMPRMNGFDLTAAIRADKRLAEKPVVLVTALASPVDREHGVDVGASAYIVKGSFDQSNLLEAIGRLIS